MGYLTRQKLAVTQFFEQNRDKHLTADEVIIGLSKTAAISKSTVYRAIDTLEKEGRLRKFNIDSKSGSCYQLSESCSQNTHFHLKCGVCGVLYHVECKRLTELEEHMAVNHSFEIDYSKTVFYGTCGNCAKQ